MSPFFENFIQNLDENTFSYYDVIVNMPEINLDPDFFILNIIEKEFEADSNVFSLSGPVKYEGKDYYQGTVVGPECIVGYQNEKGGNIKKFLARDLMPHYPM